MSTSDDIDGFLSSLKNQIARRVECVNKSQVDELCQFALVAIQRGTLGTDLQDSLSSFLKRDDALWFSRRVKDAADQFKIHRRRRASPRLTQKTSGVAPHPSKHHLNIHRFAEEAAQSTKPRDLRQKLDNMRERRPRDNFQRKRRYNDDSISDQRAETLSPPQSPQLVPEIKVRKTKPIKKIRCKFWPNCANGEKCEFVHPDSECRNYPDCPYGDTCLFLHPKCPDDGNCADPQCQQLHSNVVQRNTQISRNRIEQTIQTRYMRPYIARFRAPGYMGTRVRPRLRPPVPRFVSTRYKIVNPRPKETAQVEQPQNYQSNEAPRKQTQETQEYEPMDVDDIYL
ncbi:hypothetical protein ACOME3_002448 [Neoechinorhynchus agilis]